MGCGGECIEADVMKLFIALCWKLGESSLLAMLPVLVDIYKINNMAFKLVRLHTHIKVQKTITTNSNIIAVGKNDVGVTFSSRYLKEELFKLLPSVTFVVSCLLYLNKIHSWLLLGDS